MLLFFPFMMIENMPESLRNNVKLFNAGLEEVQGTFTPDELPLAGDAARKYLEDAIGFGEQFGKVRDISYFRARKIDDFYADTKMAIQDEISSYADEKGDLLEKQFRAQATLLLAYTREKNEYEAESLDSAVNTGMMNFEKSLGLDDEDDLQLPPELSLEKEQRASSRDVSFWKSVFESMLVFTFAQDIVYVTSDKDIVDELDEYGISMIQSEISGYEGSISCKVPGWKALGLKKEPHDRPWLCTDVTIAYCKPETT